MTVLALPGELPILRGSAHPTTLRPGVPAARPALAAPPAVPAPIREEAAADWPVVHPSRPAIGQTTPDDRDSVAANRPQAREELR